MKLELADNRTVALNDLEEIDRITVLSGVTARIECVELNRNSCLECDLRIDLSSDSRLELILVDLNPSSTRLKVEATVTDRANLAVRVGTLALKDAKKIYDLNVDQAGSKSFSLVSLRGVAKDSSELRLNGATRVRHGAKKANARQEGFIAELSPSVVSSCSPALLIEENDISASHGAALGRVDESQLFYLMSRGLPQKTAETLITLGYLRPVISLLESSSLRTELDVHIEKEVIGRV